LQNYFRKHGDENSVLECVDTGKLVTDCINEVANDAPMHFQWYGELIDKVFGKVGPTEPSITSLIVKEPIGVVAGIVPWNFPFNDGCLENGTSISCRLFSNN
jgi:aldehyde dehydrogenase (NAD+)/gamma-glutamyl-gamma-aminobutyraldehyde dehydrogenase